MFFSNSFNTFISSMSVDFFFHNSTPFELALCDNQWFSNEREVVRKLKQGMLLAFSVRENSDLKAVYLDIDN